jgi:hypothetical protein
MLNQRTKRPRPDIVRADQPQAIDALGVGESCDLEIASTLAPWAFENGST